MSGFSDMGDHEPQAFARCLRTAGGRPNYTYDAAGHVASIASSNPNGASVSYTYDDLNRLSSVVDNRLSGNNTTTYTDPASNVATATYPNGAAIHVYLRRVEPAHRDVHAGLRLQLSARGTGNRLSATEQTGRTLNWSYDGIYRLTNEQIATTRNGTMAALAMALTRWATGCRQIRR